MNAATRKLEACLVAAAIVAAICSCAAPPQRGGSVKPPPTPLALEDFNHPPEKPHDPADLHFGLDQLEHRYRAPGEFTHRLMGDEYGFEALSLIITETHPGGGPSLHVHDVEEAHVLLEGSAQYRVGEETFTVQAPYIARVPAGMPHTFINVGDSPFNLVAVFASKHPDSKRVGPNPLIVVPQAAKKPGKGFVP